MVSKTIGINIEFKAEDENSYDIFEFTNLSDQIGTKEVEALLKESN